MQQVLQPNLTIQLGSMYENAQSRAMACPPPAHPAPSAQQAVMEVGMACAPPVRWGRILQLWGSRAPPSVCRALLMRIQPQAPQCAQRVQRIRGPMLGM